MIRSKKWHRLTLVTASLTLPGSLSLAQNTRVIEEVVVTAQKTVQSLQDVPIAVQAFPRMTFRRQASTARMIWPG